MAKEYDLLVIGGGSGGLAHAQRAAEYGAQAAVIEYGPLGGTCVNVGCVPKKVMWYAAETRHHLDHAADYGFDVQQAEPGGVRRLAHPAEGAFYLRMLRVQLPLADEPPRRCPAKETTRTLP